MQRRDVLKSALAGATALAAPRIVQAEGAKTINFTPHADLASVDPVWTTADITRNFSLAVYDTLYGYDAAFNVQPQMVEGHVTSNDGKQWDLTLRDQLAFHDGTPVLARDCVATIQRFAKRDPFGGALMARTDEISAPSDKVIRFRLKKPFSLLPNALAQVYCAIMPERLAKTEATVQVSEAMGSGPFRFVAAERIPGQRVVFEKNDKYVPRLDGKPSFNAGPKVVYIDRVVWNFIPDPSTAMAALTQGEIDWWENPTIDLVPKLKQSKDLTLAVKDRTGEIGCLRFNHLYPPFDNAGDPPRGGRGDGPEGDHGGGRRRRAVADQDRRRHLRSRHADGEHGRRGADPRAEGLRQAETGPAGRRLQGREGGDPRRVHHSDDLRRGAGGGGHADAHRHERSTSRRWTG